MNLKEPSLKFQTETGTIQLSYNHDADHKPTYTTKTTIKHLSNFDGKMSKISSNIHCDHCNKKQEIIYRINDMFICNHCYKIDEENLVHSISECKKNNSNSIKNGDISLHSNRLLKYKNISKYCDDIIIEGENILFMECKIILIITRKNVERLIN